MSWLEDFKERWEANAAEAAANDQMDGGWSKAAAERTDRVRESLCREILHRLTVLPLREDEFARRPQLIALAAAATLVCGEPPALEHDAPVKRATPRTRQVSFVDLSVPKGEAWPRLQGEAFSYPRGDADFTNYVIHGYWSDLDDRDLRGWLITAGAYRFYLRESGRNGSDAKPAVGLTLRLYGARESPRGVFLNGDCLYYSPKAIE